MTHNKEQTAHSLSLCPSLNKSTNGTAFVMLHQPHTYPESRFGQSAAVATLFLACRPRNRLYIYQDVYMSALVHILILMLLIHRICISVSRTRLPIDNNLANCRERSLLASINARNTTFLTPLRTSSDGMGSLSSWRISVVKRLLLTLHRRPAMLRVAMSATRVESFYTLLTHTAALLPSPP